MPDPIFLVFSQSVSALLYYSHFPAMAISLLLGILVFIKNKTVSGKILFFLSAVFSLWALLNLIVWTNNDTGLIVFIWSFFGILYGLISILSVYLFDAYTAKDDVSFKKKIFFGLLILPIILFTATRYNLGSFNLVECGPIEGKYFTNYYYLIGLLSFFYILVLSFLRFRKTDNTFRKQIVIMAFGIEFFLISFFATGLLSSWLYEKGISYAFEIEQYGLFGMTVFMGFLVYLIVKFKAFDIKMLAAQALLVALIILIGSL
ncbi:MAG: hypothetical protein NC923_04930, partial [Candidatus Omnitrophica bacterium]|nr:hypothetical protein [Candidatus Omnitrophota bacterium]